MDFICLAERMNYHGNGKFSGKILSLNSDIKITHFDIIYEGLAVYVEDFLFYTPREAPKVDSLGRVQGVVMLPQNIMFQLNADVKEVHYNSLLLKNLEGSIKVENAALWMENSGFDLVGARFDMEGNYQPQSPFRANFEYDLKGRGFDIQKAFREIKLFRELVPAASYMEGVASLDYKLSGSFNANMEPILPSIKGEGILGLEDVRLRGFRLMNSIAARTENNELQDPNLKQVSIKSSIANNLITVERTRMRIAGFRPRFEGQVSLDGDLSIAFRLGLPPFGIFGIPIKITGNAADFEMEIGKITEEDELEEIEEELKEEDKVDEENNFGLRY
ncbi:AsmA-like C-terminal region-containing protein [Cecembia sp.]|uniref:AsmA-like C-terminal region-containing protein n=1 Tax=Cecembia sp. TaxID=1898110 RepID=UPI0025BD79D5|nr:AsmA-like C-terminal region-containing protein [Cecembia sp.]